MKKCLIFLLLLTACPASKPLPKCVAIGDHYSAVLRNCGNTKFSYRAGVPASAFYQNGEQTLFVGFDGENGKADQIHFKSPEKSFDLYAE